MSSRLRSCLSPKALSPLALALLMPLVGCGPGRNEFAPQCPTARLIPALSSVTRYAGPGPTHDLTDLVLAAQVTDVQGSCKAGDDRSTLPTTAVVTISVQRGPSMQGREADLPVFLAVIDGETVLDKKIFPVHVVFPPNVDRLAMNSGDISLNLPVSQDKSGSAYQIIAGFQLTPDELAANRRSGGN